MTELSDRVKEFAANHVGISGADLIVSQLTGDASTRTYYRARPRHTGGEGIIIAIYNAPFDETQSAVARLEALESKSPSARLTFANDPCAHIEVTGLLQQAGVPVPKIVATLGSEGAMLFQDAGDTRLQDWLDGQSSATVADAYDRALRFIVLIQDATPLAIASGSICSRLAFDEAKLAWELEFFFENYFNKYLGARLSGTATAGIRAEFQSLCRELASRPRVLVHRDYHTRNLMMHRGDIYVIDHQDARMGPASYDVASLLEDPYSNLDRETVSELIERFIDLKSHSRNPIENRTDFLRECGLMTVQRMLKAIGTYSYQSAVLNNDAYVRYIEPAIKSAAGAMIRLNEYPNIQCLLEQTGCAERSKRQ